MVDPVLIKWKDKFGLISIIIDALLLQFYSSCSHNSTGQFYFAL